MKVPFCTHVRACNFVLFDVPFNSTKEIKKKKVVHKNAKEKTP